MMIEIPGDLLTTLIQLFRYASRQPSLRTEKKKRFWSHIFCSLFFLVYLLCHFWWLLMIGDFTLFLSFINVLKKIIKFCMLWTYLRETLLFISFSNIQLQSLLDFFSKNSLINFESYSSDRIQRFSNTI